MTVLEDILAKGEVEEELLVELSDEQKVVLFYKIRQEQIKRWDKHYNDISDESKQISKYSSNLFSNKKKTFEFNRLKTTPLVVKFFSLKMFSNYNV